MNKSEIRRKILKIRKKKDLQNQKINFDFVLRVIESKNNGSKILGGYYPYNKEIDIIPLLEKFEKLKYQITLPKIRNNYKMDFFRWSMKDPLSINKYGIPEPISKKIEYPDIILVPLVAFDKDLNRIGYGGGFYDRYIEKTKKKKNILTIGLAYSFQKVKKISTNIYDMKLDFIFTEKNN